VCGVFLFVLRFIALSSHLFVGCSGGSVRMRVRYFVICLRSSSSIGRSDAGVLGGSLVGSLATA
jgi:hypothetical protein